MSLLGALDSALSGMRATQIAVQNASNNLANAGDENYTKKSITTSAIVGGSGGVKVVSYQRNISETLNRAYGSAISEANLTGAQSDYYGQIKNLYGISTDTTAIADSATNFSNAWQALTAAPEDVVKRSQVVTAGQTLATEIQRLSAGVEALDRQVRQDTTDAVDRINQLLTTVQNLNVRIANSQGVTADSGNLQDQRDTAIRELSQYVSVRQIPGDLGTVRLLTPGGYTLLDAEGQSLVYDGTNVTTKDGQNVGDILKGGKLEAMLNMRADTSPASANADDGTEVIRKLRDQMKTVANNYLLTGGSPASFAAAYNGATTATGELASSFFTGTSQYNIAVNTALTNGTAIVKTASAQPVATALTDETRNFSAAGLTTQGKSYTGFITTMLSSIGRASANISEKASIAETTAANYKQQAGNVSGVNVDEELVRLTQLQNSYAASARVITVVKDLFDTLDGVLR